MNINNFPSDLLEKKEKLATAVAQLKTEFVALDGVIDEIADLMLPWWLFPDSQLRPTIINLWGMTGSGKTALIRRLAETMSYDHALLRFDMGEFGTSGTFLKYILSNQLSQFNDKAPILLFDEFQFAKTLDEGGREANNIALRAIWDLLDSGIINVESSSNVYYIGRAYRAVKLIERCMSQGVVIKKGRIVEGAEVVKSMFGDFVMGYYDGSVDRSEGVEPYKDEEYFLTDHFCTGIYEVRPGPYHTYKDIVDLIEEMNSLQELVDFIRKTVQDEEKPKSMNLSHSLIFVVGNLDEAFYMSSNINPDISPDEFYRNTKKINIADVKFALQRRFRNEQIARLGNNHIIYHAFRSSDYYKYIDMSLSKLSATVQEKYGFEFSWDDSIREIIFKEGVFPTQGVRPVMSTIRNLVESYVSKLILHLVENKMSEVDKIHWGYRNNRYWFDFEGGKKGAKSQWSLPVTLKINSLRQSKSDDLQSQVAVHESGHAILCMFATGLLPEYVITRTVDSESQGFTYIRFPEDIASYRLMRDQITIFLGGYLAEKLLFGAENTSTGVSDDLRRVSELSQQCLREYGMGGDPVKINNHSYGGNPFQYTFSEELEAKALELVKTCEARGQEILETHRDLLLDMSKYLSSHSRLDKAQMRRMAYRYFEQKGLERVKFISNTEYYGFKKQLEGMRRTE
jgi:hypothetical protein